MKPIYIFIILVCGCLIRLLFIFGSAGEYDMRIYYYFGSAVLDGLNPYRMPIGGIIPPYYADMPPLNLGIFAMLLGIWRSPIMLRLFFAVCDITAAFITWKWKRSVGLFLFLVFNPLTLIFWTLIGEDKPVYFLAFVVLFYFIDREKPWPAILTCAFIAAYKFIGIFLIFPIIFHFEKSRKDWALYLAVFGALVGLSFFAWFPDNLIALQYREQRLALMPIHDSPFLILSAIGVYHPILAKVIPYTLVILCYVLLVFRKISILPALALILMAHVFSPEISANRILVLVFPVFLLNLRPVLVKIFPTLHSDK